MSGGAASEGQSRTSVVIRGVLRDYDWGIENGLSDWTGRTTDGPEAELWFGAHTAAPSPVIFEMADSDGLDLLRSRQVEQAVLDLIDEGETG